MKPMLARTYGPKYNLFPCFVQSKLNGIRALFQQQQAGDGNIQLQRPFGVFQSRDEKVWAQGVLQHLHDELATINLHNVILDGELYVHNWRLQRINSAIAVNRLHPTEDSSQVQFHVFDIVDPTKTFGERLTTLLQLPLDTPSVKLVPTHLAESRDEVDYYFKQYVGLGYEGLMLRPPGGYEFGEHEGRNGRTQKRSKTLWKYKSWEDGEYVCVGVTKGEGKASSGIGSLQLCKLGDWRLVNNSPYKSFACGTGFTDTERMDFLANPPIHKLIRVRYPYLSSDGIPQCPSFQCVM